ncbi:MoxR family ATPase [Aetokthonos hydrillicola Thurmond2011]|jgi:MoxR-like ATPase|uniref:MoxR family ATPase n=1 Tax=Aetokthonos hydrillicola Thurmond2011 TaxID=2712845 RepID=A0AAP5I2L6_9CYAN|nr:MoxR family ATPase [Aetokthonos hydrillicola]MBO3459359.1 MoxR family ATPase [Aetokthonos hydrillicola CCALA 1050]MBW4586505.1 MoxR family ATPase [Aetokthonos hydrillicola CCALA 1050]MDR9893551.1 MoxR family ATPase [Aetokthonos hydrillicola Thurmond2011]
MAEQQLIYTYTGTVNPKPGDKDDDGQFLYPYIPSPELVKVVNLAIHLQRPLLLKGEPGCGKTKLARAVAYELNLDYKEWNIKSTSRAKDGLYTYDAVGRLRDAQLLSANRLSKPERDNTIKKFENPSDYVKYGSLGEAINNKQKRTVLLIDEIDKADIDFPNDLLIELDKFKFEIEETGEKITAKYPPIIFITSNDEKALSDAFLRRCLFHYMEFPKPERLKEIINAHLEHEKKINEQEKLQSNNLLEEIVNKFSHLREEMEKKNGKSGKKVSTSELLDWVKAIIYEIDKDKNKNKEVSRLFDQELHPGVLLKSWEDYQNFAKLIKLEGNS